MTVPWAMGKPRSVQSSSSRAVGWPYKNFDSSSSTQIDRPSLLRGHRASGAGALTKPGRQPQPRLGHLVVVTLLQPLQSINSPCMQAAILTRLELQLDVFAAADADELKIEGLRGGALARRGC